MKFNKNKKRIDPRYFMDEKTDQVNEVKVGNRVKHKSLGTGRVAAIRKGQATVSWDTKKGAGKEKGMPNYSHTVPVRDLSLDEIFDYSDDAPTQAEFDQEEAEERKTQLYLSVLLPRAKEFIMMLADMKQPAYKDAYNGEELIGELAAVAGQPLDVMEEMLKALGEDPDDILQSDLDDEERHRYG